MRKTISSFIKEDQYLIHCDMFNINKFPTDGIVIDCGLGESNSLNIAGGIARQNNTVYVYGVAGFIIHRLEQLKFSCLKFGAEKGKIIIFNAGKIGYDNLGDGHKLDDDIQIMEMYKIKTFVPKNLKDLNELLQYIESEPNGMFYIQLGKDYIE